MDSEHIEQRNFVSWFRQNYKGVLIFAIPNGGARNKITAGKLKLEGVTKGIPDLYIPEFNLWIEMKTTKGGRVSPEQKEIIGYLNALGHHAYVCHGCDEAKKVIINYLPPAQGCAKIT